LGGVGYGLLDGGRIILGLDEVIEHCGEVRALLFFYVDGGGEFCDAGDGAEFGVEDEFFD
jgi:hypothetical protein